MKGQSESEMTHEEDELEGLQSFTPFKEKEIRKQLLRDVILRRRPSIYWMMMEEEVSSGVPTEVWRFGPAELVYDMAGVPRDGELDYNTVLLPNMGGNEDNEEDEYLEMAIGSLISAEEMESSQAKTALTIPQEDVFNINTNISQTELDRAVAKLENTTCVSTFSPEHPLSTKFSLVTQMEWEKDVIWSPTRSFLVSKAKEAHAGWIPTHLNFLSTENELRNGRWEDEVIWDGEYAQFQNVQPKVPVYDVPDDPAVVQNHHTPVPNRHPRHEKSFYNVSNDLFYETKKDDDIILKLLRLGDITIRHSRLVRNFVSPFIKPLREEELRHFHRPKLSSRNAPTAPDNLHFLKSTTKRIQTKAEEWNKCVLPDLIRLDNPIDLSGRDGDILLMENCEEHPPLLSQVGMCSKLLNYYVGKPKHLKTVPKYGDTMFVASLPKPYLGNIQQGMLFHALENSLYCAPIYPHAPSKTDFLVIRNRHGYMIREFNATYTCGQQCPLVKVPDPNSIKARNTLRDLVQAFVYRKYWKCPKTKRQISSHEVGQAFPMVRDSNIRTWLKSSTELKKIGNMTWFAMKPDFQLPDETVLEEMITPEQFCAYYSMLSAKQRLKDAGYNSMLSLTERENSKVDEEVQCAPWNTTSAFIEASKGKCMLQIEGAADPTGCGEGFSYIRVARSVSLQQFEEDVQKKNAALSSPGGTDGDLRRLPTKTAKELLRKFNVSENEIQNLKRWEIIDMVRKRATEKAIKGQKDINGIFKFSRWKGKNTRVMNQQKYKEDCQRIFDLQNQILSSEEILSSEDSDDSEEEDEEHKQSDIDVMGKNIEKILSGGKAAVFQYEEEERERIEMQLMFLGKVKAVDKDLLVPAPNPQKPADELDILAEITAHPGRALKIVRTYKEDASEKTFIKTEIVRDPAVITAYLKIRSIKDQELVKDHLKKAELEARRDQKQREKELVNQFRVTVEERKRQNRKRKRELETEYFPNKMTKELATRQLKQQNRKCGKCGLLGHVRTSAECPMFN